jgi:DNA-binding MarR family transcriptional regulator
MGYEKLKLKNQLCHALYSAANANIRTYEPYLKAIDLTYPQYLVMMALWEQDQISISQLSDLTYFDSGSLTPLLKRLDTKGLIKIAVAKDDLRRKVLHVTKKGERLKEKAAQVPELMSCHLTLTAAEFAQLKTLLEKVRRDLCTRARDRS